ncbi:MAG: cysteine desulfurase-like protein [Gemmatimonadota bacterium]
MSGLMAPGSIRARFPALERMHGGHQVAYFDGPGGTQVSTDVVDAVSTYLLRHNANTHWGFPTSAETDEIVRSGREAAADLLGGARDEIVFGQNMTTLTFQLARALGRQFAPGTEIVVTQLDHRANVDPWLDMASMWNFTVRTVPFHPANGLLDWNAFESMVSERTGLIAIGGASNALGTVNDVRRAAGLARSAGSLLFVDAVHAAPHLPIDVSDWGCDALACSPYKFYGPHAGILWVRRPLLESLHVSKLLPASNRAPERLETGTLSHEAIAGTTAAIDFLASLDDRPGDRRDRIRRTMQGLHDRGDVLVRRLWSGLAALDAVRLFGPAPGVAERTPTVSFIVDDIPSSEVSRRLAAQYGIFCSFGDFYAADVTVRLGVEKEGLVRAGCACYTTEEEVDRLIQGIAHIVAAR